ncbi:class I SAM-dependent methyltransferase [Mesorhizobium australafricanum]|uniref:Class I SAM-dependent methyltransferase n=1 Tax=Mesorhizobium australafricanum TaxID=3072311 RepID=A0ABU4WPK8_9HYPH|nr:class I SAM-dependent methyltransferase [Mesorhizobium sp. VK3E]MDX8437981.1 class I SAM-dependent methyltransferase [Mesorhizobium sp. VK3E]
MSRDWENWDASGIASEIQTIWQNSAAEAAHREQLVDTVRRHAPTPLQSVLEVGCGTGLIYEKLMASLPASTQYVGVDSSINMLEIARQNFPRGQFIFGDGYGLVFRDQEFDVVLCFEVLGHIPQIEPFVAELLRVTKQTCIFTTWPTDLGDTVEGQEVIGDVSFLQRRYSDSYIKKVVHTVGAGKLNSIEAFSLNSGGKLFVIQTRS